MSGYWSVDIRTRTAVRPGDEAICTRSHRHPTTHSPRPVSCSGCRRRVPASGSEICPLSRTSQTISVPVRDMCRVPWPPPWVTLLVVSSSTARTRSSRRSAPRPASSASRATRRRAARSDAEQREKRISVLAAADGGCEASPSAPACEVCERALTADPLQAASLPGECLPGSVRSRITWDPSFVSLPQRGATTARTSGALHRRRRRRKSRPPTAAAR
jgi:hypothetical protein